MQQLLDRFVFRISPTTVAFVKSTDDDRLWCAHTMRQSSFRRLCVQQKTKIAWCVPGFSLLGSQNYSFSGFVNISMGGWVQHSGRGSGLYVMYAHWALFNRKLLFIREVRHRDNITRHTPVPGKTKLFHLLHHIHHTDPVSWF